MKVRWQVKISNGQWMNGTHGFKTRRAAVRFAIQWCKAEDRCDASLEILRNGVPIDLNQVREWGAR